MSFIVISIFSTPLYCMIFTMWSWMMKTCLTHIRVLAISLDCVSLVYSRLQWVVNTWNVQASSWLCAKWTEPFTTFLSSKQPVFSLFHTTTTSVCPLTTAIAHNATLVSLNGFFAYNTRVLYRARVTFNVPRSQQQCHNKCCWPMKPVKHPWMNPVYTSMF